MKPHFRFFMLLYTFLYSTTLFSQAHSLIPYRIGEKWGASNSEKNIILPAVYDSVGFFHQELGILKLKDKYGLANIKGEIIANPIYDSIGYFNQEMGVIKLNGKYGLANKKGEIIADLIYDQTGLYGQTKGQMMLNGDSMIIDKDGNISPFVKRFFGRCGNEDMERVVRSIRLEPFKDLIVEKNGKYGILPENAAKTTKVAMTYDAIAPFNAQFLIVKKEDKWGLVNRSNEIVIPFIYDAITAWGLDKSTPLGKLVKNKKYGFIDQEGKIITPENQGTPYDRIIPFRAEMAYFRNEPCNRYIVDKGGKWGIVNIENEIILPIEYGEISPFTMFPYKGSNMAIIQKGGKYGLIDANAKHFWEENNGFKYDSLFFISYYTQEIIAKKGNKWGLISFDDRILIPFEYDSISLFHASKGSGLFYIEKQNKFGLAHKGGNIRIPPKYKQIKFLPNRFIEVQLENNKWGYVSLEGVEFFEEP